MASSINTAVTTQATQQVKLSPALKTRVLRELRAYAANAETRRTADAAMRQSLHRLEDVFDAAGEGAALDQGVSVDEFTLKVVNGTSTTLSKRLLLKMGVSASMLEEATEHKPKRPYLKVMYHGDTDEEK